MTKRLGICVAAMLLLAVQTAGAAQIVRVIAGADSELALRELTAAYGAERSVRFEVSVDKDGTVLRRLREGAAADVYFSADTAHLQRLEGEGIAVAGTRSSYAIEKLVLWTPRRHVAGDVAQTLNDARTRTLAIADPATPHGAAATRVLRRAPTPRGVKIIRASDASAVFRLVSSGGADAGIVARSQVRDYERANKRSLAAEIVAIDPQWHAAIEHQAVMLKGGQGNDAAREFLAFVRSESAQRFIASAGFGSPTWLPPDCRACERPSAGEETGQMDAAKEVR